MKLKKLIFSILLVSKDDEGSFHITHSSTAKQEEKQEERGSCQTLAEIQ